MRRILLPALLTAALAAPGPAAEDHGATGEPIRARSAARRGGERAPAALPRLPGIPPDELGQPNLAAQPDGCAAAHAAVEPSEVCPTSEPPPNTMPPRIASGPPITNYIPPSVIMAPIRARAGCFRGCYRAGLARNPGLTGRIATRFVIDSDGWVRRARIVTDEQGDADVADCVRRAFIGLRYEALAGEGVTVVYPLQFSP